MMLPDTDTETRHLKANNYNLGYALMDACKEIDAVRAELSEALMDRAQARKLYEDKCAELTAAREAYARLAEGSVAKVVYDRVAAELNRAVYMQEKVRAERDKAEAELAALKAELKRLQPNKDDSDNVYTLGG